MNVVEYELRDQVAHIYLNRPERLNAVIPELVEELCYALEWAGRNDARAVVLRGKGRAFCAGHDLRETITTDEIELRRQLQRIQDITRLVRRLPCPVIASVQGYALGAGCEFALCSDLVIAAEDARFGFPEVEVALSVTGGITHILPHAVGFARAKELLMFGEHFTAQKAQEWGLINRVVPLNQLAAATDEWAAALAAKPRIAISVAKHAIDSAPGGPLEAALETEASYTHLVMRARELTPAAAAFSKSAHSHRHSEDS